LLADFDAGGASDLENELAGDSRKQT
jgi:hypothetical protein